MKFIIALLLCTAVYGRINDSPFFGEASNELTSPISGIMGKSDFDENPGGVDADPSVKRILGLFPFSPFTLGSGISPISLLNIGSGISPLSLLNLGSKIGPLGLYRQSQRTSSDLIGLLNTGLLHATGLKKLLLDAARTSGQIESNISDEPVDRQVSYDNLRKSVIGNPVWNNLVQQLYEVLLKAWNLWNSKKRSATEWYSQQREVSGGRRGFAALFNVIKNTAELWGKWGDIGEEAYNLGVHTIKVMTEGGSGKRTVPWFYPFSSQRDVSGGRRSFADIYNVIKGNSDLWAEWADFGEKAYNLGVETLNIWNGGDSGKRIGPWIPVAVGMIPPLIDILATSLGKE